MESTAHNLMVRDSLDKISRLEYFNRWLFNNIRPFLGNAVLDAGCGSGNITQFFGDRKIIAIDNNKDNVEGIKKRLSHFPDLKVFKCDLLEQQFISIVENERIDTVVCINTLEHIKEDALVLERFHKILQGGGNLIVLVPALKFLYSSLDKAAGHYRRYSRKELIRELSDCNFKVVYLRYFNFFGILGWLFYSKILKRSYFSDSSLNIFKSASPLLVFLEKHLFYSIGLSLLVVCTKTAAGE